MTSLISGKANAFKAAVQTSPALIDPADAEKVVIPMMMLASKVRTPKNIHPSFTFCDVCLG
jgi:hypothetical protein